MPRRNIRLPSTPSTAASSASSVSQPSPASDESTADEALGPLTVDEIKELLREDGKLELCLNELPVRRLCTEATPEQVAVTTYAKYELGKDEEECKYMVCLVCACCKEHFPDEFNSINRSCRQKITATVTRLFRLPRRRTRHVFDYANFKTHLRDHHLPPELQLATQSNTTANLKPFFDKLNTWLAETTIAPNACTLPSFTRMLAAYHRLSEACKKDIESLRLDNVLPTQLHSLVSDTKEQLLKKLQGQSVTIGFDTGTSGWKMTKWHDCAIVIICGGVAYPWSFHPVAKTDPESEESRWSEQVAASLIAIIEELLEHRVYCVAIVSDGASYCNRAKQIVVRHFLGKLTIFLMSCAQHAFQLACATITNETSPMKNVERWNDAAERAGFSIWRITAVKWNSVFYAVRKLVKVFEGPPHASTEVVDSVLRPDTHRSLTACYRILLVLYHCSLQLQRDGASPFLVAYQYYRTLRETQASNDLTHPQKKEVTNALVQRWLTVKNEVYMLSVMLCPEFPFGSLNKEASDRFSELIMKFSLPLLQKIHNIAEFDLSKELLNELADWTQKRVVCDVVLPKDLDARYDLYWETGNILNVGRSREVKRLKVHFRWMYVLKDIVNRITTNEACCERLFAEARRLLRHNRSQMSHKRCEEWLFARNAAILANEPEPPCPVVEDEDSESDSEEEAATPQLPGPFPEAPDSLNSAPSTAEYGTDLLRMYRTLWLTGQAVDEANTKNTLMKQVVVGCRYAVTFVDAQYETYIASCVVLQHVEGSCFAVHYDGESKPDIWDTCLDYEWQKTKDDAGANRTGMAKKGSKRQREYLDEHPEIAAQMDQVIAKHMAAKAKRT